MIEIKQLTKKYGDNTVLSIEELKIKQGECVILTGHNGSGKSTLLKLIAGTLKATDGVVEADGTVLYLPQHSLPFNKTVKKNILYCIRADRKTKMQICRRVLEELNLTQLQDKNARVLSGGECQRLALARVVAKKCDILLLDEPTSAADTQSRALINRVIAEYYNKTGCTLIMTTHIDELPSVEKMRVIKLCDGKIVEDKNA